MEKSLFKLKLACLFHDPPIKPLASWVIKEGHKKVAEEIINSLNKKLPDDLKLNNNMIKSDMIKHADWVAASADRLIISELYKSNVARIIATNILDMNSKDFGIKLSTNLDEKLIKDFADNFSNNLFGDIELKKLVNNNRLHIIYHIIWRFLIEATIKSLNNKDFALLPADTRVPYYTIYDHLYTSSGFLVSLKDDQSTGKVGIIHWEAIGTQSFIRESRAFRDLWASSFLISLINTAIIIRLAKDYGFDSIFNPNMLYNPLIDLYLYAHTYDKRFNNLKYEELKIPITPDKGFAIVPYNKLVECIENLPEWFNSIWRTIVDTVKTYIENNILQSKEQTEDLYKSSLKEYLGKDINELVEPPLTWDNIWEEVGYEIPINFICVGEKLELKSEDMNNKLQELKGYLNELYDEEELEKVLDELNKARDIASAKYHDEFLFFEFPLIIEILKKKRKLRSEIPRVNTNKWILNSNIYIKDRRLICSVCYKRPAVIFGTKNIIDKLYEIKEDERLCPICLTKRMLARPDVFIEILSKVYNFADYSLECKEYRKTIESKKKEYEEYITSINGSLPRNILTIPSLDTISTLTFRSSIKYVKDDYKSKIVNIIKEIEPNHIKLFKDMPDSRFFDDDDLKNNLVLFIGGEYFLVEELKKSYLQGVMNKDEIGKLQKSINELQTTIRDISKELNELKFNNIRDNEILSTRPGKYIALIKADGDNIGKLLTLSGNYKKQIKDILPKELKDYLLDDNEEIKGRNNTYRVSEIKSFLYMPTPSFYSYISRALASIARNIVRLATQYATVIVYAGGDDILAISPVELSLLFVNEARKVFSQEWIEPDNNIIIQGLTTKTTQSFAIRYFHVFSPLFKELADLSNDLELAKCIEGKNGLVITYNPRGGNKLQATLKCEDDIIRRIFNLSSMTLKYKRIIQNNNMVPLVVDISLSDRVFRDILTIANNNNYNNDIISFILEHEFKKHTSNNSSMLQVINRNIDNITHKIKVNDKERYVILELIKGVLVYVSSLDSMPLVLGDRL